MRRVFPLALALLLVPTVAGAGQGTKPVAAPPALTTPAPAAPSDALGRTTPHGSVSAFLAAARKGDYALASHYLNTKASATDAEQQAHELFFVLDARLPARLNQVSDAPEGSHASPLQPDRELVGTIPGPDGPVDVVLERVRRSKEGQVWLFSNDTLDALPRLYADVLKQRRERFVPRVLIEHRVAGLRLFDWIALLGGLPLFYLLTVALNRVVSAGATIIARRLGRADQRRFNVIPMPARLLLLSGAAYMMFSRLPLSLLFRQLVSNSLTLVSIVAGVWLLLLVTAALTRGIGRRYPPTEVSVAVSLIRVGRRIVDVLIVVIALLLTLRYFGIDATPVLAGLGVGGVAVALAAQKTLENVIAGASLIFDKAVRVGDFMKAGELVGTVDHIGLRSTRIRTLDRTVVSVPNGQIANMSLETISARDKFWFHPVVGLRYETTAEQLHTVIDGIKTMLMRHPAVEISSARVRFLRLGAFSLDVEVSAYLSARDFDHFLELQEQLLFRVTDIVHGAGTEVAFPSQTMYLAGGSAAATAREQAVVR